MIKDIKNYNKSFKNKMKKRMKINNLFFFVILILSSIFVFNKCECPNGNAFKKADSCVNLCSIFELINDNCKPVSKKEEDINNMIDLINSYFQNFDSSEMPLQQSFVIKGEGINYYIITKDPDDPNNSNLLKLEEKCINAINRIDSLNIVLINIINTNYITTTNGIQLINEGKQTLSDSCFSNSFNIGIDIEISSEEKSLYKQIKDEYSYEILNIDDTFYVDICTKFTTPYKTDISLRKRKEVYGIYAKDVCSDICAYEKFDESKNKIFCNCIFAGEKRIRTEIKPDIINIKIIKCIKKIFEDFPKNYMVFVMSFLCFLFLICFFTTSINLSKEISNYKSNFSSLKSNFSKVYLEELNKENASKEKEQDNSNISYDIKLDFEKQKKIQSQINVTEIQIFNRNLRNIYDRNNPYYRYYQYQKIKNKYMNDKLDYLNNYYDQFYNMQDNIMMRKFKIPKYREFDKNTTFTLKSNNNNEQENKIKNIKLENIKKYRNNKKGLYEELRKQNNIDIFKKKGHHDKFFKNDEKIKNKEVKEDIEDFSNEKRFNTYNRNNKIMKRNNRNLKLNNLDNLDFNLKDKKYKPNPPKYPIASERDLISSPSNQKNGLNLLNKEEEKLINNKNNQGQQLKKFPKNNDNIKNLNFKFGSDEFFKFLNKIPEKKRKKYFKESELNHLEYKYAYDIDDRTVFVLFSSIIKEQNNLIFSLSLCGNDYNLPVLKFSFLIIQLILYLTVSCLFFVDNVIDHFYEQHNKFDIKFMLKPMLLTFAACFVICILLKNLIKLNNIILEIKYGIQEHREGLNAIRLKLIFYFIICFVICAFGWILVCTFCAIFTNSVIYLIITAGLTFVATFFFQIFLCFFISSFRACSLNTSQKNCKCLYCFSNILTYT